MGLLKTLGKFLIGGVVAVAALTIVGKVRQQSSAGGGSSDPGPSAAGFVLLRPDGMSDQKVVIMAPPNCPSQDARRARALGDALARAGIPHEMRQEIGFTFHDPDEAARVQKFMANISNPLVVIRGRAKGNPTLDEVIAEYRAGR